MFVVEIKISNYSDETIIQVIPAFLMEWFDPIAIVNALMIPGTLSD